MGSVIIKFFYSIFDRVFDGIKNLNNYGFVIKYMNVILTGEDGFIGMYVTKEL